MGATKPIDSPPAPRWRPRRLLVTRSAREFEHGRAVLRRAHSLGINIVELSGDRPTLNLPEDPRRAYVDAKATLALVVAPPSKLRLQPIAPSADWRVDLAEGCPAHCSYCYLAGSLKGPPVTRVYANLEEIFGPSQLTSAKAQSPHAAPLDRRGARRSRLPATQIRSRWSRLRGRYRLQ
jgi:spore photoproduct lyase